MGIEHGFYCLGCCWLLFVILFPVGIMNVAAMAVITLLVFAEKNFRWGERIAYGAAVVLVAYGLIVLVWPTVLPTFVQSDGVQAPADGQEMPPTKPADAMPSMGM